MRFRISLRIQFYLLMIVGFAGVTIASFSPFLLIPMAIGLCLQPLSHFIKHPRMAVFYRTGIREALLLILAYLLISLAWGEDAKSAFLLWLQLFAAFVGGCLIFESVKQFNHRQKQALADAFISGMAIVTIITGLDFFLGRVLAVNVFPSAMPMAGELEYGAYAISLLVWPCLAYFLMKGRARLALLFALMLAMILMKMDHPMAILALAVGAVFMALSYYLPRIAVTLFLLGWTGLLIAVPLSMAYMDAEKLSVEYQDEIAPEMTNWLYVWEVSAKHALDEDPNGAGLDSAGKVKLGKKETLPFDEELEHIPLPANGILQLWLELGLIGLFGIWILVLVAFFSFRNMVASAPLCKMAAVAQLAALVVLPLGFENIWNIPFLIVAMFSFLALHICVNAAARNVI